MKLKTLVMGMMALIFAGCSTQARAGEAAPKTKENKEMNETMKPQKILIAYYSYSGNTRVIAEDIQKATGGELFEIVPAQAYPKDYDDVVAQAKQEIRADARPELKTKVANIAEYDAIFVGSPNWWSTIAPPVMTFLTSYDLADKKVIPFITHGGGGLAKCADDVKRLAPKSTVLTALSVNGGSVNRSQGEVQKWLRQLGFTK